MTSHGPLTHSNLKVHNDLKHSQYLQLRVCVCVFSWGSGADLWGSEGDSRYGKPRIDDGMLEVVGVTGVVHMVSSSPTALTLLSTMYVLIPQRRERSVLKMIPVFQNLCFF